MAKEYAAPIATEKVKEVYKEFKRELRKRYSDGTLDPAFAAALCLTVSGTRHSHSTGSFNQVFEIVDGERKFYIRAEHGFGAIGENGVMLLTHCDFALTGANGRPIHKGRVFHGDGMEVTGYKVDAATKTVTPIKVPLTLDEFKKRLKVKEFDECEVSDMIAFVDADAEPVAKYRVMGHAFYTDAIFLKRNDDGEFETPSIEKEEFEVSIK